MNSAGYVIFDGIDCIYTIDKDGIELFPTQEENIGKLNRHFDDQNFFFHFSDRIEKHCIAYIDRVENHIGQPLRLFPNYIIKLANTSPISSMRITGASIDEIFHPASYYYSKHETGKSNDVDLAYNTEIADHWDIRLDGETISVSLLYGGILDTGIASDLMLHPRLLLEFRPTTDYEYLFKIYSVIIRFLQLTQYNSNCGECKVYLRGNEPAYNYGYLFDWRFVGIKRNFYNEVEYRYIKPYIGSLFQFSANNPNTGLDHLPNAEYRWNRKDYSPQLLSTLFAAFESEYKANANEYETEAKEDLLDIKEEVVRRLRECKSSSLTDAEKWFLAQAESRIQNIGNQVGQTKKVKNALGALDPVLRSSAQYLFIRNKIGSKDGFSEKEITAIANGLVGLRAQVSHEYTLSSFDDLQAEFVRFLEILVHAQMLKRAGVDNYGIELIIGIVFHCNNRMMENILEMNKMNEKT